MALIWSALTTSGGARNTESALHHLSLQAAGDLPIAWEVRLRALVFHELDVRQAAADVES